MTPRCKIQLHVTCIVLCVAILLRPAWTAPLLIANSVVGMLYMTVERDVLRTQGSALLGGRAIKLDPIQNVAVNLFTHLLLPAYALKHLHPPFANDVLWILASEVVGILCIDTDAVYPTQHSTIAPYIAAHVAIAAVATYYLYGPSFGMDEKQEKQHTFFRF